MLKICQLLYKAHLCEMQKVVVGRCLRKPRERQRKVIRLSRAEVLQRTIHLVSFVENNSACQKMVSLKMIGLCAVIIIIIIIKNELIIVTLHTKVLQGHFTQINATLQMLRNIIRLLEQ